jgi:H+-transporting ATPase
MDRTANGETNQPGTGAPEDIGARLNVDVTRGLDDAEAARRLEQYGRNEIAEHHVSPIWRFLSFFWGPIPWMIEVAAILSAVARKWEDFVIIAAMLLINAGVGFFEEYRADHAIAALKQHLALLARVLRGGKWREVAAGELVPGDIVAIRLGNIIPADLHLIEGEYLSVDQSALTGESLPVERERGDTVYSGSIVRMGEMTGVVTATAMNTYFGKTARLVETATTRSHFQQAVLRIGNFLMMITLALVSLILIVALFRHDPFIQTVLFALILTVAAIPVALPAVLSVTMAVGASRLAHLKAIVSRLISIEEMAGMDVLCSDKTGTLTQNRLTIGEPVLIGAVDRAELMQSAAFASRSEGGDAIDQAIVAAAGDHARLRDYRTISFAPFDPVRKRTEAVIEHGRARLHVSKGAPQVIAELVGPDALTRDRIDREVETMAQRGFRALGVARAEDGGGWRFLGLLPMFDPPREDSAAVIAEARSMGVDVKMVTGDHIAIAREIAGRLNLGQRILVAGDALSHHGTIDATQIEAADGFAEVFPEHKFQIVGALQVAGHIVGMTGDGVNDAPALKQADVGIAVSGATDAARAAAALVLTAPGLGVIMRAVEEARQIFERMNSYAIYRIAETIRVLLFMTLSIIVFNFYPVTAVMIVILAILNDFPIMTIAYDNAPIARRPVRWAMHRVLTVATVLGIAGVGASFLLFWIAEQYLRLDQDVVRTLIFLKLLVAGHLTIYLTRNVGTIWQRPWPNWRLIVAAESTQVVGTLAAVYGWLMTPIGWHYAIAVWFYALAWWLVNSGLKIATFRMLEQQGAAEARHIARVERSLHLTPR